ncbi:MAG: glycogen phosphorylase, partial [Ruminococcus sp.]|nr:glycogen phosphorylase [Ruminococcus sp.]
MDKTAFLTALKDTLGNKFGSDIKSAPSWQLHDAVSDAVMNIIDDNWSASRKAHLDSRRACYLSMEFLVGRAVFNNLLCLGIKDEVDGILKENGRSL